MKFRILRVWMLSQGPCCLSCWQPWVLGEQPSSFSGVCLEKSHRRFIYTHWYILRSPSSLSLSGWTVLPLSVLTCQMFQSLNHHRELWLNLWQHLMFGRTQSWTQNPRYGLMSVEPPPWPAGDASFSVQAKMLQGCIASSSSNCCPPCSQDHF